MNRRRFLSVCATAPLAGCLCCNGGDDEEERTVVPSYSMGGPKESAFGTVDIESVAMQKSVIDRGVFRVLYREKGVQYLLLEAGDEPPAFVPVFDDEVAEPAIQIRPTGPDTAYVLGVDVEAVRAADSMGIALEADPDVRWPFTEAMRMDLANPPDIRIREAAVVTEDDDSALRLTAENVGARSGVLRGIVLSPAGADLDDEFAITIRPDETVTETVRNAITADWGADYDLGEVDPDRRVFGEPGG